MLKNLIKSIAYIVLDMVNLGKGVKRNINGFTIRFPARWSRYYEQEYEKENYVFLKATVEAGMNVIDIGAHIGLFSTITSKLVGTSGRIIAFEPTPGTFEVLQQTLQLNKCDNVQAVQAAVSDKVGLATFYISDIDACNSNSLVKNKQDGEAKGYDVKLMTIDRITMDNSFTPSLIKIDAEGAELDVLKGGVETFKRFKPIIVLGLHPEFIKLKGDTLEQIWDLLVTLNYQVRAGDSLLDKNSFCNQQLIFDVHCS